MNKFFDEQAETMRQKHKMAKAEHEPFKTRNGNMRGLDAELQETQLEFGSFIAFQVRYLLLKSL